MDWISVVKEAYLTFFLIFFSFGCAFMLFSPKIHGLTMFLLIPIETNNNGILSCLAKNS